MSECPYCCEEVELDRSDVAAAFQAAEHLRGCEIGLALLRRQRVDDVD
jgi:hypothetical protein